MSGESNDVILAHLADIKEDLGEIKDQVKLTNGRVSQLELWRHGLQVLADSQSWMKPALISFVSGGALAILAAAATAWFTG